MLRAMFWFFALVSAAAADPAAPAGMEAELAAAIQSPQVTVVHLWAPWCPNCLHELAHHGWSDFLAANPQVHFIFVTIWNDTEGREVLARNGVGTQANLSLYLHPNPSRIKGQMLASLLGQPVTWIPTTWVYKGGKLRYALNYGELRFSILQQMLTDSTTAW